MPTVFAWVSDPVRSGIVADFGRPGANTTGVTNRFLELAVKRVELIRELVPSAKRVAVLAGVFDTSLIDAMEVAERAAEIRQANGFWTDAGANTLFLGKWLALAFVLRQRFLTAAIIGATTLDQLKTNIGAAKVRLGDDLLAALEDIHKRYTYPCP